MKGNVVKIALFDPYGGKFTDGMQKWWESHGHEVKYNRYYNPEYALWADVIWFDTADNNVMSGTNPGDAIMDDAANFQPWDLHDMDLSNKRVICRPIDIEVWQGHMEGVRYDVIDDLIFIAPHIREIINEFELRERREDLRIHNIPHCVDLDKWTYKEREIDPRYKIHWLGQRSDYAWEHAYFDEFIEHFDLPIEITNIVDSVDTFLEGKNYLLHASHKEAFSAATAEAMAKGIKPVLHRFYGADALWPDMTWNTIDEAVAMITEDKYDSASYRQYLIDHGYTLPQMMERIDKIIKGEEE